MIFIMYTLLVMFILTLDRLICGKNPLKYKIRMTNSSLKKLFLVSLSFSIVIGISARALFLRNYTELLAWPLAISYTVIAIMLYSIIIAMKRKSNRNFTPSTRNGYQTVFCTSLDYINIFHLLYIPYSVRRIFGHYWSRWCWGCPKRL